ncbi:LOC106171609 [Symbiodinium sp. KB8]|nr:LOC106171609 [Symbiodinium sp. KB8]
MDRGKRLSLAACVVLSCVAAVVGGVWTVWSMLAGGGPGAAAASLQRARAWQKQLGDPSLPGSKGRTIVQCLEAAARRPAGSPAEIRSAFSGAGHDKLHIAVGFGTTTRGVEVRADAHLTDLPLMQVVVPTLFITAEDGFRYSVVAAFDDDDPVLASPAQRAMLQASFAAFAHCARPGLAVQLLLVPSGSHHAPSLAHAAAMAAGAAAGADFLYRINDDTSFVSGGWAGAMVQELLLRRWPPLVGMTGPKHDNGNTAILTHDFTHATHLEVFPAYYPHQLRTWFTDDWVSHVYGLRGGVTHGVVVDHTTGWGQRYSSRGGDCRTMLRLVRQGQGMLRAFLRSPRPDAFWRTVVDVARRLPRPVRPPARPLNESSLPQVQGWLAPHPPLTPLKQALAEVVAAAEAMGESLTTGAVAMSLPETHESTTMLAAVRAALASTAIMYPRWQLWLYATPPVLRLAEVTVQEVLAAAAQGGGVAELAAATQHALPADSSMPDALHSLPLVRVLPVQGWPVGAGHLAALSQAPAFNVQRLVFRSRHATPLVADLWGVFLRPRGRQRTMAGVAAEWAATLKFRLCPAAHSNGSPCDRVPTRALSATLSAVVWPWVLATGDAMVHDAVNCDTLRGGAFPLPRSEGPNAEWVGMPHKGGTVLHGAVAREELAEVCHPCDLRSCQGPLNGQELLPLLQATAGGWGHAPAC